VPPELPEEFVEQEGPAVGARIKGLFAQDEELTTLLDEAKARGANREELNKIYI